jgi:DNA-binding NarL/FixJ family response regulator
MKIVILDDHPLIIQLLENEIGQILPSAIIKSFTSIEPAANYIESNNIDFAICDHVYGEENTIYGLQLSCE